MLYFLRIVLTQMFGYGNMWLLYHLRGLQLGKYAKDVGAGFSGVVNVNVIGTGERYSAYLLETAAPSLLLVD